MKRLALVVLLCLTSLPGIMQSIQQGEDSYVFSSRKNIVILNMIGLDVNEVLIHHAKIDQTLEPGSLVEAECQDTEKVIDCEYLSDTEENEFLYPGYDVLKLSCTTLIADWNLLCNSTTHDNKNEYKGKPPRPSCLNSLYLLFSTEKI